MTKKGHQKFWQIQPKIFFKKGQLGKFVSDFYEIGRGKSKIGECIIGLGGMDAPVKRDQVVVLSERVTLLLKSVSKYQFTSGRLVIMKTMLLFPKWGGEMYELCLA